MKYKFTHDFSWYGWNSIIFKKDDIINTAGGCENRCDDCKGSIKNLCIKELIINGYIEKIG